MKFKFFHFSSDGEERNLSLVEDAGALSFALREEEMFGIGAACHDDVTRAILVDLQEFQEVEIAGLLHRVVAEDLEALKHRLATEQGLRRHEVLDNVFSAFVRYHGAADDRELLEVSAVCVRCIRRHFPLPAVFQALRAKFDALRDKVLVELLIKEVGEAAWRAMSEKERQQRLTELRLRERMLRKEEDWKALSKLLNDDLECRERLRRLMGASRAEMEAKLRARRAKGKEEAAEDSGIEEEEEAVSAADFLADIDARYEEEVKELLRRLHGSFSVSPSFLVSPLFLFNRVLQIKSKAGFIFKSFEEF